MNITRRTALPLFSAMGITAVGGLAKSPFSGELFGAKEAHANLDTLMDPGPLGEHIKGDPNAPVTIIKYASMTCPHCRAWHKNHYPAVKAKYIDQGIAKFYLREFPFDPAAAAAFMLAHCAGEEKYFSMIDVLYEKQAVWKRGNVVEELFKIAQLAGFSRDSFQSCLQDQKLLDSVLAIQKNAADKYKVNSTPTFFINGTKYGNMSAEAMGDIIEALV